MTEPVPTDPAPSTVSDATSAPVLIGCSHGTADPAGQAAIRALLADVRLARPDLEVREAFVDVQQPALPDVVAEVVAAVPSATVQGAQEGGPRRVATPPESSAHPRDAVVVPLLLSGGFHVNVDVAEAVTDRGPEHGDAAAARPLGPDPRLAEILADRLRAAGVQPHEPVVLAAAGSSDARATSDVEQVAAALRGLHPGPVTIGYGSMATPSVPDAVRAAREALGAGAVPGEAVGTRVAVAAYLLAPGLFFDRVCEAGADVVSAPLAPDPRLTAIVLDRYVEAVAVLRD